MVVNLADKASLALGALSGQLATMRTDVVLTLESLSNEAAQLLLSPDHMLSLSYLTVITALTAMYVEQSELLDTPFDFSQGSLPKLLTGSGYSSRCGSAGSSSNTSPHSSRRVSTSQDEDGDPKLHEHSLQDPSSRRWVTMHGNTRLLPSMSQYHNDMLRPFGIHVDLLLGPAMHNAHMRPLSDCAAEAQDLLMADLGMLSFWMYSRDVQQHQRQAVQPHLQLMVQC